jgi:hypothetical protein
MNNPEFNISGIIHDLEPPPQPSLEAGEGVRSEKWVVCGLPPANNPFFRLFPHLGATGGEREIGGVENTGLT